MFAATELISRLATVSPVTGPTENVVFDKLIKSNIDCIQPQKPQKYEFYSVLVCFLDAIASPSTYPSQSVGQSFIVSVWRYTPIKRSENQSLTK